MYLRVSGWFLCVSRCKRLDTFGYGYDTTWPVANTNVSPHVTRGTYPPKDTLVNTYRIQSRYTDTGVGNTYPGSCMYPVPHSITRGGTALALGRRAWGSLWRGSSLLGRLLGLPLGRRRLGHRHDCGRACDVIFRGLRIARIDVFFDSSGSRRDLTFTSPCWIT